MPITTAVTGNMYLNKVVKGSIDASSSISGLIKKYTRLIGSTVTIASSITGTAVTSAFHTMVGVITATVSAAGVILQQKTFLGVVGSVTSTIGRVGLLKTLISAVDSVSSFVGQMIDEGFIGTIASTINITGILSTAKKLAGSFGSTISTTITATMAKSLSASFGSVTSFIATSLNTSGNLMLQGVLAIHTTTGGMINILRPFASVIEAVSTFVAANPISKLLVGSFNSVADFTAETLIIGGGQILRSTIDAVSTLAGRLSSLKMLGSTVSVDSTFSSLLRTPKLLMKGAITATSAFSAKLGFRFFPSYLQEIPPVKDPVVLDYLKRHAKKINEILKYMKDNLLGE